MYPVDQDTATTYGELDTVPSDQVTCWGKKDSSMSTRKTEFKFSSYCECDIWNNTGDPLHSQALAHSRAPLFTQPCPHCSHSRAPGEQWARLCVFTLQDCVQAARLCRGSPVNKYKWTNFMNPHTKPLLGECKPPENYRPRWLWKTLEMGWICKADVEL